MRCEHCDYLLFNLTQPICPECGRGFEVEWYRFEPGIVSFNCPHCDQEYYGNDERGLPYPRQFACVRCGQPVTLQQLRVVPKRDDAEGAFGRGSPWDKRSTMGTWSAWWATLKMILLKPGTFYRNHSSKSIREAWLFAVISLYVGLLPAMIYATLLMWVVTSLSAAGGVPTPFPFVLLACSYLSWGLFGPLVAPFISAGINSAFIHLALLVLAPQRKPIGDTFRLAMYALGPTSFGIIPLLGDQVGSIWSIVVLIIGVKEVHRISGLRATVAVLWPLAGGLLIALTLVAVLVLATGP